MPEALLKGVALIQQEEGRMKLSEAILLGSTMHPQTWNSYYRFGGTCAQGAGLAACGVTDRELSLLEELDLAQKFQQLWPWTIANLTVRCPCGCSYLNSAMGVVAHLNDTHEWTRERIAEWVATIEPNQEQASEEVGTSKPLATENGFVDEKDLKNVGGANPGGRRWEVSGSYMS